MCRWKEDLTMSYFQKDDVYNSSLQKAGILNSLTEIENLNIFNGNNHDSSLYNILILRFVRN